MAQLSRSGTWGTVIALAVVLLAAAWSTSRAAPSVQESDGCSQLVTLQRGDGWQTVAQRYGVTVAALKAANPNYVRANDYLWLTDRLCIPGGTTTAVETAAATAVPSATLAATAVPSPTPAAAYYYSVRPGQGWFAIARSTGVPFATLWKANPMLQRPGMVLYIGDQMLIPGEEQAPAAVPLTATVTLMPSGTEVPSGTAVPLAAATATPTPTRTAPPTATATRTPASGQANTTPQPPVGTGLPACPGSFADYMMSIDQVLNIDSSRLESWLRSCNAITAARGSVTFSDLNQDKISDAIVVITDPTSEAAVPSGDLLIYHGTAEGRFDLAYQAGSSGDVALLEAGDLNADGNMDVAWTDTTCGAHTCFATVFVIEWDGSAYQDWIDGNATMAYPDVRFADVNDGSGKELLMHGGIIASVGAGPQRAWTETWASLNGAPYTLVDQQYDASTCLYHHILDANQYLLEGKYEEAAAAYTTAMNDTGLEKCGTRLNELAELRSFAGYRLALAEAYGGNLTQAEADVKALQQNMPNSVYGQIANIWWTTYGPTRDAQAACTTVKAFAQVNPESWQMLSDFGYANPTFSAADVCVTPAG